MEMVEGTLDVVQPLCTRLEQYGLFRPMDIYTTEMAEENLEDLIESTEQEVDEKKQEGVLDLDDPVLGWTQEYQ